MGWAEGPKIELRANGERCRESIEWIATQMPEIDPLGIESNRWRETEWCISGPHDINAIRNCWNPPNGPILEW